MGDAKQVDVEQRLETLEGELRRTRAEVQALRLAVRACRPWRVGATVAAAMCIGGLLLPRTVVVEAQGAGATLQAPWKVLDKSGQPLLSVDESGVSIRGKLTLRNAAGAAPVTVEDGALLLGERGKGNVEIGVAKSGNGFVSVQRADGSLAVGVGSYQGNPSGVYVLAPDQSIQASIGLNARNVGQLALGKSDAGGMLAGVGASGAGFALFTLQDGKHALRIGAHQGKPFAVTVVGADGETPQASLGLDDRQKGILRVGDPAGARGVIGGTPSGGVSFALYDGPGTDYRIGMVTAPEVTYLRLNKSKVGIHLNVDGNEGAGVHVFNALGSAAASLQSMSGGSGRLTLGDASGDTTVEAGTTTDGLGLVRVGPRMGGSLNNLGALPFALLGKKK